MIVIGIFVQDKKVRYENMTRPISNAKSPNEVIELIEEIMYLTLNKDENRNYQIKLNGYIQYITASSMLSASSDDIMTKYFDNDDKKGYIYLFLQINKVYQYAISRFPYSAALRIHYAIFLNDYLSRKDQAMIELTDATRYHLTFSEEFIVYQLSKLPKTEWKAFVSWLEDLEYEKFGLPRPDRVIYLDVPPKISQRLLTERYAGDTTKKDIHESDIHYLLHCRDCALYAAEHLNWTVLNCAEGDTLRSIEDIHHEIKEKLEDLL